MPKKYSKMWYVISWLKFFFMLIGMMAFSIWVTSLFVRAF
jgi:membrane protein YdbS with pleckstrin-like domain